MYKIIFLILGIFVTSVFPENITLNFKDAYKIYDFKVKDFNRNTFSVFIDIKDMDFVNELASTETIKSMRGETITQTFYYFDFYIGNIRTEVVPGTFKVNGLRASFDIFGNSTVPSGNTTIDFYYYPPLDEKGDETPPILMDSLIYEVPARPTVTSTISRLYPSAGKYGDLITVVGKNLGKDPNNIKVYFIDSRYGKKYEAYNEKELGVTTPIFLSAPDEKGLQEAKFTIPSNLLDELEDPNFLRNKIRLRILVNYALASQESDSAISLDILHPNWKKIIFMSSFLGVLLFLALVPLFTGKWDFIQEMLKERITNTYSLSRFQAFIWTVTLFASYLYISLCYGLLKDGEIPEFNMSLLGLMGISYGSLLSANHLSYKNPKNEIRDRKPGFADLIMQNGSIDITRFQMFSFTILTVGLYIFNLYNADILMGMPDIPTTLHGLLLSSQAGYLGGKVTGDKIVVNQILPSKLHLNDTNQEITLIGNGFTDGMKVMLEGGEPIKVQFIDPTTVKFVPKDLPSVGLKNILLIPSSGSSIEIKSALEILPPKESNTTT